MSDIVGTNSSDVLAGTELDDVISGGNGNYCLSGGEGDDLLLGGRGSDWLFGGEGDDILRGGSGSDWIDGGEGVDLIDFSDGNSGITAKLKLAVTEFVADFAFNSTEKKVYSKTIEHANSAIKLTVDERSAVQATPWIFYQFPDLFDIKDSKYQFELIGYKPRKYTGLQIAKNPGINIVWLGSTLIVVGITLSSFIYHRRLWTKIVPSRDGVTVHIGGSTHKSQIDFQKEFRKLTDKIRTFSA